MPPGNPKQAEGGPLSQFFVAQQVGMVSSPPYRFKSKAVHAYNDAVQSGLPHPTKPITTVYALNSSPSCLPEGRMCDCSSKPTVRHTTITPHHSSPQGLRMTHWPGGPAAANRQPRVPHCLDILPLP